MIFHTKRIIYVLLFLTGTLLTQAQSELSQFAGKYGDAFLANGDIAGTELELRDDGTFKLRWVDNVYPQRFQYYTNEGKWIVENEVVILNPDLAKREVQIHIQEKKIGLKDSIEIKVNHYVENYENQAFISKERTEFELLTLYFNKKRNYRHLTRDWLKTSSCAWAPRIRNRVNVDASNTIKIPKKDIQKIGVYTYGFTDFIELEIANQKADYFEIDVIIPIDKERMPRGKKVIVKGKRAYFYEWKGKVSKSLNYLVKLPTEKS